MDAFDIDAYSPAQIAARVEKVGITKGNMDPLSTLVLAMLAGAFISLGAILYTFVTHDAALGLGVTRLLGGLVFCLGLILVIVLLIYLSGHLMTNEGAVGLHAIKIANAKTSLPFIEAMVRGILCNVLVCLAVFQLPVCNRQNPGYPLSHYRVRGARLRALRCEYVFHFHRAGSEARSGAVRRGIRLVQRRAWPNSGQSLFWFDAVHSGRRLRTATAVSALEKRRRVECMMVQGLASNG